MSTKFLYITSCIAALLAFPCPVVKAQASGKMDETITLQALDGRNGKPFVKQHLLVFVGYSAEEVKTHSNHIDLTTDNQGQARLTVSAHESSWIQVWVDGRVLCFPDPNQSSFSITQIVSKGLVAPNNCSALVREASPGQFIIFARPASLLEKMKK